jgi:hypothetical protein
MEWRRRYRFVQRYGARRHGDETVHIWQCVDCMWGAYGLKEGKQVHAFTIRNEYNYNVFGGSALVDMYCGSRQENDI